MLATVLSGGFSGIQGYVVRVESDVGRGLPSFTTVGLGDSAVREGRDRVAAALRNSGLKFPMERITVNLAPADVRKEGAGFDLPIAVGLLAATRQIELSGLERTAIVGELALDGSVRGVRGVLPIAVAAERAGVQEIIVPVANAREAETVGGLRVLGVESLASTVRVLAGGSGDNPPPGSAGRPERGRASVRLSDIRGQVAAKRALEIAAAGGHNLLMVGPPGVGKTMLARALPGLLPPLTREEALVATMIASVAGLLPAGSALLNERPFRAPHHTVSDAGLVGGGRVPRPGEVSLAHGGVLFLDELPEFRRNALESLRQPVEEGRTTVTRSMTTVTFPSEFMLVASMNPCPCGNFGHPSKACRCAPSVVSRYLRRVSGPLMERIDVQIAVAPPTYEELTGDGTADDVVVVVGRVMTARGIQRERWRELGAPTNARAPASLLVDSVRPSSAARTVLRKAVSELGLSARSYHKVLRIARTIADLAGVERVETPHVCEAIQYRTLDRDLWRLAG